MKDLCLFCGIFMVESFIYFLTRLHLKHFTSFCMFTLLLLLLQKLGFLFCCANCRTTVKKEKHSWQSKRKGEREMSTQLRVNPFPYPLFVMVTEELTDLSCTEVAPVNASFPKNGHPVYASSSQLHYTFKSQTRYQNNIHSIIQTTSSTSPN